MEEEVKKWLKKKLEETAVPPEEIPKPVETPPQPEEIEPETTVEETPKPEMEELIEPVAEPSEPGVKAVEIPKIKENLRADMEFPKIEDKEKPGMLPIKTQTLTGRSKILLVLIVVLAAFLVYWLYVYLPLLKAPLFT